MKKDRFPDIKIEIRSEGLAKKILGKPEASTPSVYGEEQPEGKNLPNVEIKGKNKELQSLLETSNKKPNYTGLVKEAVLELRKDNQNKYAVGSDKPELTAAPQGFERGPEFKPKRTRKDTPTIYRGTGFRGRETDAPLMDEERPYMGGGDTPTTQSPSEIAQRGSEAGPTVTPYSASDVLPRKKLDARTSAIASEVASQTQNMVKEAVQELRKAPEGKFQAEPSGQYGKFQPGGRTGAIAESIGTTSQTSADIQSAPMTQTVERDVRINEPQDKKPGNLGLAGDIAVFGDKYGPVNVRGTTTGTPDEVAPGMPGAGGVPRLVGTKTGYTNINEEDMTAADKQARASALAADKLDYGSIGSMGAPTRAATSAEVAEREQSTKEGDAAAAAAAAAAKAEADKLRAASELQSEDELDEAPVVEPEEKIKDPVDPVDPEIKDNDKIDNVAGDVATATTGVDTKLTEEIARGVQGNPEITRPKGKGGQLLPEFGSSGYFSAVLSIGEGGKNVEANYGVTGSEDGSTSPLQEFLSLYTQNPQFDQSKFLENLGIEQPEQKADIEKANPFKASLKKQAPMVSGAAGKMPKSTTMNNPANMGVGMQQPVVTGAGTMKNTEKAVAANKPAAVGASKKTRATKRKAGSIAELAKKALIKKGMVWDITNNSWVPIRK